MAPSPNEVRSIFSALESGDYEQFWSHVDPNVEWTVTGTSVLSATYHSAKEFRNATFGPLNAAMKAPVTPRVKNVVAGSEDWAAVELEFNGEWKDGSRYDQQYAWFLRWDASGKIVQVRAYLDTIQIDKGLKPEEEG